MKIDKKSLDRAVAKIQLEVIKEFGKDKKLNHEKIHACYSAINFINNECGTKYKCAEMMAKNSVDNFVKIVEYQGNRLKYLPLENN